MNVIKIIIICSTIKSGCKAAMEQDECKAKFECMPAQVIMQTRSTGTIQKTSKSKYFHKCQLQLPSKMLVLIYVFC